MKYPGWTVREGLELAAASLLNLPIVEGEITGMFYNPEDEELYLTAAVVMLPVVDKITIHLEAGPGVNIL